MSTVQDLEQAIDAYRRRDWSAAYDGFRAAGWLTEKLPGPPGKREMTRARKPMRDCVNA